jgi:lipoprotein-releasing system permease protein
MSTVSLLLAWRYLKNTHTQQNIHRMIRICFVGVFIGTFSLSLVLAIMHGFEQVTHEKFRGIHTPVTIRAYGEPLDVEELATVFEHEFPEIAAYSPSDTRQVIIQSKNTEDTFTVVTVTGVFPQLESNVHVLSARFVPATTTDTFVRALHEGIILGKKLAQELHVVPGDAITILYPHAEQTGRQQLALDRISTRVGGIFDAGIDEIDSSMALCSFDFLQSLFSNAYPTQIGLTLKPGYDEQATIEKLIARTELEVFSWKDLYPALVAALKLEKYALFLIVLLITLVASMNIISLLFMQITHKRSDIAILKAMGMPNQHIQAIFMWMGMGISLVGSLCGLIAATVVGYYLEQHPFITLPDVYYVSHLPIQMTWAICALVMGVTLLLSLVATWLPTARIAITSIAGDLRMEP